MGEPASTLDALAVDDLPTMFGRNCSNGWGRC